MEVISPKIIDDQRDAESFKEEGASSSNLVSPSENVTRKSTDENDSAADKKSSTELLKESALVLNTNEPEPEPEKSMSGSETNENKNWLTER